MKTLCIGILTLSTCFFAFGQDDWEEEQALGREVAARILGAFKLDTTHPELTKKLNIITRVVAEQSSRPSLAYRVAILDTHLINAFSAPAGYIFVTRGLLERVQDEAELAVILGHEVAHVDQKHILKAVKRAKWVSEGASLLAGQLIKKGGGVVQDVAKKLSQKALVILFSRGLDKKDEYESDRLGFQFACQSGFSATKFLNFLEVLKTLGDKKSMGMLLKTHPRPSLRIKKIHSLICQSGIEYAFVYEEKAP